MSNSHEPPYVRLDDKGLEKVFDKMKSFASKKSLEQVADRVPSKQKQEYWDNKADLSDIPSAIVPDISASATVDSTSSPNPSVEVVKTGTDEEPSFTFNFHGIKGTKGDTGATGAQGPQGPEGPEGPEGQTGPAGADGRDGTDGQDGADGVSPEVTITTITDGHTVTITDKDHPTGQSFNVMDGAQGPAGADGHDGTDGTDGADGVSPAVTITSITGGHEVKITDKTHPTGQSFNVMDGQDGADGAPGATGPAGPGVPSGGTAGQVLSKVDGTDYNTAWTTPSSGGGTTIPYIKTWDSGSTSTTWKATVTGYTAYTEGDMFLIKPRGTSSNIYININSLGSKYLYADAESYNKLLETTSPVLIVYNGTYFYTINYNNAIKVLQQNTTNSLDYRVLLSYSADDTKTARATNKSSKLTFNPSTGALVVTGSIEANSVGTNLAAAIQQLIPSGGGQQILCTSEIPYEPMSGVYEFSTAYIIPSGATAQAGDALVCNDGWIYFISSVSGSTITSTERSAFSGGGGGGGGNYTKVIGELQSAGGGNISGITAIPGVGLTVDPSSDRLPLSTFQVLISNQQGDIATLNPIAYNVEAQYQKYPSLEDYFSLGSPYMYDQGFVHLFFQTAPNFLIKASFEFEVTSTDEITFTGNNASYQQVYSII